MENKTTKYMMGKPVRSKEDFLRDCYVKLYSAKDVGEDIDTILLSVPSVETTVEITQETTFNMSYQVKLGYHYTETGMVTDTYEVNGVKRTREYERSEVRTEWKDYTGEESGVVVRYQVPLSRIEHWRYSGKEAKPYPAYCDKAGIRSVSEYAQFEEASAEVTEKLKVFPVDYDELAEDTVRHDYFEAVRRGLPGDEYRDFEPQWTATKMAATVASLDSYRSTFEYREKQYSVEQFVSRNDYVGKNHYRDPEPAYTYEQLQQKRDELMKTGGKTEKEIKLEKYGTYGCIAAIALGFVTKLYLISVLGLAGVIGLAFLSGKGATKFLGDRKKAEETARKMLEEAAAQRFADQQNKKMELLNKRFVRMGMQPLTEAERNQFGPEKVKYFEDLAFVEN